MIVVVTIILVVVGVYCYRRRTNKKGAPTEPAKSNHPDVVFIPINKTENAGSDADGVWF